MAFEKIENADLIGKMIAELADVPELTADELKKRFDAASKDVIIPKFNKLIDALAALSAASNIGMNPPEGITAEQNIAAVITALAVSVKSNSDSSHTHRNKAVIDAITADAKKKYDDLVSLFSAIKTISNVVKDDSTLLPTGKAIVDYVKELGGGDMLKATYDSDDDGVVDDASKLGGQAPAYYQKSTDSTLQTDNKTVTGAINEVYGMAQNGGKNLIGEDFSSEKSYTVGKHVINGNSRYRFIVDHPAGPWDASHVEEIPVDKEMEDLNENLNIRYNKDTDKVQIFFNGVWTDWQYGNMVKKYLYIAGDECTDLTNGYVVGYYSLHCTGSKVSNSNYLQINVSGEKKYTTYAWVITKNAISTKGYTKLRAKFYTSKSTLKAKISLSSKYIAGAQSGDTAYPPIVVKTSALAPTTLTEVEIDISGYQGNYYVVFGATDCIETGSVYCSEIWLER